MPRNPLPWDMIHINFFQSKSLYWLQLHFDVELLFLCLCQDLEIFILL